MDKELKACPFCGAIPKTSHRPESQVSGGGHVAFVVCYCDGYASTAHQMGHAETVQAAIAEVVEKWNTRAQLPSQGGEAVEIEYPTYHAQGMGCGLEERDASLKQVEWLRLALSRIASRCEIFIDDDADMRTHSLEVLLEIAREALQAEPCVPTK